MPGIAGDSGQSYTGICNQAAVLQDPVNARLADEPVLMISDKESQLRPDRLIKSKPLDIQGVLCF